MESFVCPFDHKSPADTLDTSSTESPEQNVVALCAVIIGAVGVGFTVMEMNAVSEVHSPFETVTK